MRPSVRPCVRPSVRACVRLSVLPCVRTRQLAHTHLRVRMLPQDHTRTSVYGCCLTTTHAPPCTGTAS